MSFSILTESTCDLTAQQLSDNDVFCLPLGATLGSTTYMHYADGREMSYEEFYRRLRAGEMPSTSAVNVSDWIAAIEARLPESREILILAFSSGLSSTYQNACLAAQDMTEKHGCRIEVIDTLAASAGEGLLVLEAARLRREGKSLDETAAEIRELVPHTVHWFTVDDLHHLHRGGRVSAATAIVGSALGIKPVLHVDDEGHLINMDKARGRKKSILALLEHMRQTLTQPEGPVLISHGDCPEDAQFLADEILKLWPVKTLYINPIGPIIGGHAGANTLALFFIGSRR
ncbi:MAG: DegV family protein [Candidatus Heteroscillospira sp.]|jgi:DegV family protein with EDD domain